ncbi:YsnF/AvaK domain-containing protein [Microvirga tunisiensis]|nr:YsnF/AvaK domain-containing protein [Microvirga tunisiensis]
MVTALFDSRSAAEHAIERLVNAGVPHDRIDLMPGDESEASDNAGASSRPEPRGFWSSLGDWLLPDEDRHVYTEGLSRGGYLISVTTGDEHYARVMAILDSEDVIDIDEQAESWRPEGWAGWSGAAAGTSTAVGSAPSVSSGVASVRAEDLDTEAVASLRRTGVAGAETGLSERGEQVLPVVEERLRVGKRDVSHGHVRVRSYVVGTPVDEQVSLRKERIAIERRPADRALSDADQAFQERAIEVEGRSEEAVVSKEAGQRTETVFDTVRETEIEVEDERGNTISGTGTTDRT